MHPVTHLGCTPYSRRLHNPWNRFSEGNRPGIIRVDTSPLPPPEVDGDPRGSLVPGSEDTVPSPDSGPEVPRHRTEGEGARFRTGQGRGWSTREGDTRPDISNMQTDLYPDEVCRPFLYVQEGSRTRQSKGTPDKDGAHTRPLPCTVVSDFSTGTPAPVHIELTPGVRGADTLPNRPTGGSRETCPGNHGVGGRPS